MLSVCYVRGKCVLCAGYVRVMCVLCACYVRVKVRVMYVLGVC